MLDEPIAIRTLKRFAVEHGRLPAIEKPAVMREGRVGIVGGGPAGMSAAYYLARLGYRVTVFEAMPVPGGMMAIGIPEYRLPRAALRAEIQRILDLGVELRLGSVMGRDFTLADLEAQGFKAIFLATGASRSRRLGVPGDDLPGVIPATVFLKETNIGEPPALSGAVVVVGGGSTAMDAARSALRSGAASVTVVYRRRREDMPAQHEEVEAAEREGVRFMFESAPDRVVGEAAVTGLAVRRQALADAGVAAAVDGPSDAPTDVVPAATILVAIGEEPDPSILPEGAGIEVTATAGIATDPGTLATGRAGVFAGGDVVSGPKTIIDAVAAGRRAAGSIHGYLAGVSDGEAAVMAAVRYRTAIPDVLPLDLAVRPRARAPLPMFEPGSFAATQQGFEPAMAQAEAARCFRCDAVHRCGDVRVTAGRQVKATAEVATQEDGHDARSGLGVLRRRRELRRRHHRGGAGRPLDPRPVPARGATVHGRQPAQVHAPPGRRPVVDRVRRPARPHPGAGLPGQLHLLLPGRGGRQGPARDGRAGRGLRLRRAAHETGLTG